MNTTASHQPRLFTEAIECAPDAGTSDEWYTPRHVIEAARVVLGGIDLDPASCATAQDVVRAGTFYTKEQDGLSLPWFGRVWLNPPYSYPGVQDFSGRLHADYQAGTIDAAMLLINNTSVETAWCQRLLQRYPICIHRGRINFYRSGPENGTPRYGSLVFYLGPDVARFADVFSAFGVVKR